MSAKITVTYKRKRGTSRAHGANAQWADSDDDVLNGYGHVKKVDSISFSAL